MSFKSLIKNAKQDSTLRDGSLVVNIGSLINTTKVKCLPIAKNSPSCHIYLALPHTLGLSFSNWTS